MDSRDNLPLNYAVGAFLDCMDAYEKIKQCIEQNKLMEAEIQLHTAKKCHKRGMELYDVALRHHNDPGTLEKSPEDDFGQVKRVAEGMLAALSVVENRINSLSMATKPFRRASTVAISTLLPITEIEKKTENNPPVSASTSTSASTAVPPSKINGISSKVSFFERRLSLPITGGVCINPVITNNRPVPPPLPTANKPKLIQFEIGNGASVVASSTTTTASRTVPPPLPRSYSLGIVPKANNSDEKGGERRFSSLG